MDHKPLKEGVPLDKAKQWLVKIKWNREEEPTWEPLSVLRKDDPMTLATYAHEHNLTNYDGWKWARKFTKNHKKFVRLVKVYKTQAKKIGRAHV